MQADSAYACILLYENAKSLVKDLNYESMCGIICKIIR